MSTYLEGFGNHEARHGASLPNDGWTHIRESLIRRLSFEHDRGSHVRQSALHQCDYQDAADRAT